MVRFKTQMMQNDVDSSFADKPLLRPMNNGDAYSK